MLQVVSHEEARAPSDMWSVGVIRVVLENIEMSLIFVFMAVS